MCGVTLLPQEFARAQEQPRAHLPPQDVAPLVVEQREIAIALDPGAVRVPYDRLGRGTDDERLLELLPPAVRHDRDLGSEALDVLGLLLEEAQGEQQREVDVLVTRRLEAIVEGTLDVLPYRVAMRLDDHRALGHAVLGHAGALDDLDVPRREVLALFG